MAIVESSETVPPRTGVIPGSYAINVTDRAIHVWTYRVTASAREGEWSRVETIDRSDDPYLSLDFAKLTAATDHGYWVYSRSYECKLDCA